MTVQAYLIFWGTAVLLALSALAWIGYWVWVAAGWLRMIAEDEEVR